VISLAAGDAGKRLEITNKLDWQSKGVSLKAAFPLAVSNDKATYNLGAGTIQRGNNNEIKFEVPSKEWIDLTDNSGNYGVSILEDCKYGSDKPDDNTLRLTLIYSPRANSYLYQSTQDWGIHDIKFGVYGHEGDWVKGETPWQGRFLNQPLLAFEVPKHNGKLGKEISLLKINSSQVGLMAFKKMEDGDYYIVRVNELFGKDAKGINLSFPGKIVDAYEVNGQEKRIGSMKIKNGSLNFDITHYTIRSFAVKFENPPAQLHKPEQIFVKIPYNQDAFTFDSDRSDGDFDNNMTLPAELFPEEIISEDISFKMGNFDNDQNNVVAAKGQEIKLPEGNFNKLYLLAAATVDTKADFKIDGHTNTLGIQDWTGYIGQHYNRKLYFWQIKIYDLIDPFLKRDNIAWYTSHRHTPSGNDAYQYSYLFKYEISLPENAKKLVLPDNNNIKIFAVTLANNNNDNISTLQPLYDDFKNNKPIQLRNKEYITNDLTPINVKELPLFIEDIPERFRSNRWFNRYLQSLGIDSIVKTLPSTQDYADLNTGNNVSMTYYATGFKNGEKIENKEIDVSHVFNSQSGKLKDSLWFSNGEGRYLIDLQKSIPIEKMNMYFNQNRNRGYQIFSIWGSNSEQLINGNPKKNNWEYINAAISNTSNRFGPRGKSIIFKEEIKYRYIMFVTDSYWHGSDYFNQIDIFEKKQEKIDNK